MALRRAAVAAKPVRAFSAVSDAADAPAASNRNVGKPLGTYQWDDPLMMQGMLNEGTYGHLTTTAAAAAATAAAVAAAVAAASVAAVTRSLGMLSLSASYIRRLPPPPATVVASPPPPVVAAEHVITTPPTTTTIFGRPSRSRVHCQVATTPAPLHHPCHNPHHPHNPTIPTNPTITISPSHHPPTPTMPTC